jgi:hypothetical protein
MLRDVKKCRDILTTVKETGGSLQGELRPVLIKALAHFSPL